MITFVNSENANRYSVLFENATQALVEAAKNDGTNGPLAAKGFSFAIKEETVNVKQPDGSVVAEVQMVAEEPIDTIERYFSQLKNLVLLGNSSIDPTTGYNHDLRREGRRYIMLPLDEDHFEIDADKRNIEVPAKFRTNGVAVQGDQLAEVLYFKIDRYYDAQDLNDTDIFIQWTNAKGESGLSAPIVIDIESEPDKMIFGWALSDRLTSKSGNIQFAVRFYKWKDKENGLLKYSLATQTATIKVNNTLDFELSNVDLQTIAAASEEDNKMMIDRIRTSYTYVTDNISATDPIFILNLDPYDSNTKLGDKAIVSKEVVDGVVYVYADLDDNADGTSSHEFKVQAKTKDNGGKITYAWGSDTYSDIIGSDNDSTHSVVSVSFVPTEDTVPQDKIYYKQKNGNTYEAFDVTTGLTATENPKTANLYERIATCKISKVGTFFARVTNTVANRNAKTLNSNKVIIPRPEAPNIEAIAERANIVKNMEDPKHEVTLTVIVNEDEHEAHNTRVGTKSYQWEMRNDNDPYKASADDAFVNKKEYFKYNSSLKQYDLFDASKVKEGETPKSLGLFEANEFVPMNGQNKRTLTLAYAEDQSPKDVEGFYRVTVFNSKNGETESVTSNISRVSYMPEAPLLTYPLVTEEPTPILFKEGEGAIIHVTVSEDWKNKWNISDELTYQWYSSTDADENGKDVADIYNDTPIAEINGNGATTSTYKVTSRGRYFCAVTNKKNNEEATVISNMFVVG